jgi:hypothetical protein
MFRPYWIILRQHLYVLKNASLSSGGVHHYIVIRELLFHFQHTFRIQIATGLFFRQSSLLKVPFPHHPLLGLQNDTYVTTQEILTSALDGGEWSASKTGRFTAGKSWVGPEGGLNAM